MQQHFLLLILCTYPKFLVTSLARNPICCCVYLNKKKKKSMNHVYVIAVYIRFQNIPLMSFHGPFYTHYICGKITQGNSFTFPSTASKNNHPIYY